MSRLSQEVGGGFRDSDPLAPALSPSKGERGQPVRVRDVRFVYPGTSRPVLDGFTLDIAPGEFVCLLGPSGCGKSTLLRLVAGLLRPTSGDVDRGDRRSGIGWMAQRDGLLPWRRVLANVALPLEVLGERQGEACAAAQRALALVGLEDVGDWYPHQLSGGMRQRAALARAVAHAPGLLLLDEPFAHLDELTRDELGNELVRLWSRERPTVLMVTHSALEAVRLAQRVVVLPPGPAPLVGEVRIEGPRPGSEEDAATIAALAAARRLLLEGVRLAPSTGDPPIMSEVGGAAIRG